MPLDVHEDEEEMEPANPDVQDCEEESSVIGEKPKEKSNDEDQIEQAGDTLAQVYNPKTMKAPPKKRKRSSQDGVVGRMAVDAITGLVANFQNNQQQHQMKTENDENELFGKLVAVRLSKLDSMRMRRVRTKIFALLDEAESMMEIDNSVDEIVRKKSTFCKPHFVFTLLL